ncbi:unnamed protein product [Phaeothamnion confervicola]
MQPLDVDGMDMTHESELESLDLGAIASSSCQPRGGELRIASCGHARAARQEHSGQPRSEADACLRRQVARMDLYTRDTASFPKTWGQGGVRLRDLLADRAGVIDWLDSCAQRYRWADSTVALALSSWDRYLVATYERHAAGSATRSAAAGPNNKMLILAAYVAALIASKVEEPEEAALDMNKLAAVVQADPVTGLPPFSARDVRAMELSMLRELRFGTNPPLAHDLAVLAAALLPGATAADSAGVFISAGSSAGGYGGGGAGGLADVTAAAAAGYLLDMRYELVWLRHDALTLAAAAVACALVGSRRTHAIKPMLADVEAAAGRSLHLGAVVECAATMLGPCAASLILQGGRSSPTGVDGIEHIERDLWADPTPPEGAAAAASGGAGPGSCDESSAKRPLATTGGAFEAQASNGTKRFRAFRASAAPAPITAAAAK